MSASNSATDIVNLAMDIIKTSTINDVEMPGSDTVAAVANRWYDDVRQDALEGFPWNFALKRDAIPLNATTPDFEFTDQYQLPTDYLSLMFIKYSYMPLSEWDYRIEGKQLVLNNGSAESLEIGYIYDIRDTVRFSPSFKLFLAARVAEQVVFALTGSATLRAAVIKIRKEYELSAKAKNGMANPPIAYRQSRMLNARRLYGGSTAYSALERQGGRA